MNEGESSAQYQYASSSNVQTFNEQDLARVPYSTANSLKSSVVSSDVYSCLPIGICNSREGISVSNYCPDFRTGITYSFAGTQTDGKDIRACIQVFDTEEQCRQLPMNIYVDATDVPSEKFLHNFLSAFESPAIKEDPDLAFAFKEAPFNYGSRNGKVIDSFVALAFFRNESQIGIAGGKASSHNAIGNIRYPSSPDGRAFCTKGNIDGYCAYEKWSDSVKHWFWLIGESGVYASDSPSSLDTVDKIYPKYAPAEDNNPDPSSNIRNAKDWVCHWRGLWKQYRQLASESA